MPANIPSEAEVLTYFDKLSNLGTLGGCRSAGNPKPTIRHQDPPSNRACTGRRNRILLPRRRLDARNDDMATPLHFMLGKRR